MAKQKHIEQDGVIRKHFLTPVPCRARKWACIIAHISGKMRMHYIKLLPGDKVN
jgi:translation initiation factor IF-1